MNQTMQIIDSFMSANNITIYGTAPASMLDNEPQGRRPADLLAGARSMVCFALPVARGMYQAGPRTNKLYWRQACLYYRHLDILASQLAALLEGPDHGAALVPTCFPFDVHSLGDFSGFVSLSWMAQACGLGVVGKNGMVMHPEYGPRLHFGGLITTLDLPQVSFGGGDKAICPEDCTVCIDACPAQALEGGGQVDRPACVRKSSYSPLVNLFLGGERLDKEQLDTLIQLTAVDDHQMYTCISCISACPLL